MSIFCRFDGMKIHYQRNVLLPVNVPLALLFVVVCLLESCIFAAGQPEIKQVIVISRHGSRDFLPKNHMTFKEGKDSELTVRGMDQMFRAGKYVRQRYSGKVGQLLSIKYNVTEVYVRSSDYSRTLNSALSFIMGLYQPIKQTQSTKYAGIYSAPYNMQQVPIHTVAVVNDQLLRGWLNCSTFIRNIKNFYESDTFKKKEKESLTFLKELESITGLKNIKLKDFYNVYDFIHLHQVYGHMYLNLTDAQWQNVVALADWIECHKYGSNMIGSMGGGILASQIAADFQNTKGGRRSAKLIYYSAHYPTIVTLFSALGINKDVTLQTIPYYASLVFFELLNDGDDYYVKFAFRNGLENDTSKVDDPFQYYKIPGCEAILCPLEKFNTLVTSIQVRDLKSWCSACRNEELPTCQMGRPYTRKLAMTAVGGFFTGVFVSIIITVLLVGVWHFCLQKRCLPGGSGRRPSRGLPDLESYPQSRSSGVI